MAIAPNPLVHAAANEVDQKVLNLFVPAKAFSVRVTMLDTSEPCALFPDLNSSIIEWELSQDTTNSFSDLGIDPDEEEDDDGDEDQDEDEDDDEDMEGLTSEDDEDDEEPICVARLYLHHYVNRDILLQRALASESSALSVEISYRDDQGRPAFSHTFVGIIAEGDIEAGGSITDNDPLVDTMVIDVVSLDMWVPA